MSEITLIQKIKDVAAEKVATIKSAGEADAGEVLRESEAVIAEFKAEHEAALKKELEHLAVVAISKARQTGKIAVQNAKREQIDNLFDAFMAEYAALESDDYVKLFKRYAKDIVPKSVDVVAVKSAPEREKEISEIAEEFGFDGKVKADSKIKAGLVIETKDGVYDITLDRIVGEIRSDIEMQIMQTVVG